MGYKYYLTQRPPSIGTFPDKADGSTIGLHCFDYKEYVAEINRKAWGYVVYSKPLTQKEIDDYELIGGTI